METAARLRAIEEQRNAFMLAILALARALGAEARAGLTTDLRDAANAMARTDGPNGAEPDGAALLRRLAEALAARP